MNAVVGVCPSGPLRARAESRRRVGSAVRAGAMGQKDQKEKPKTMPGFRYDTTYQRWIRDEKATNGVVTVTTMTGEEYTAWPVCYALLESKGIKSYEVEDVLEMVQKGKATLIDIRPENEFKRNHAEGAVNVPLFIPVQRMTPGLLLKRIGYAFLAMTPRERNPNFVEEVERALGGKNKPCLIMCGFGGSMEQTSTARKVDAQGQRYTKEFSDPDKYFGRESRSLKACYELLVAGFTRVMHVRGGYSQWLYNGLPVESD